MQLRVYLIQMKIPRFQLAHLGSIEKVNGARRNSNDYLHTLVPFAVCACFIAFNLDESLQCLSIACGAVRRLARPSRHSVCSDWWTREVKCVSREDVEGSRRYDA